MLDPADKIVVCESPVPGLGQQRVVLNLSLHCPRKFFSSGCEAKRICRFEDLHAAHDFLSGEHHGTFLRTVIRLGHLINVPVKADELGSIFISTDFGRCRVFADWTGFDEFRNEIHEICKQSPRGHWSDDPRMIPLYVVIILGITGGLIWWLL